MPTVFTPAELKARFSGIKKSLIYDDAVSLYTKLRVHADGEMPIWLIKAMRPNESEEVRTYREKIYEAETQNPVEKVLGILEKIRRSPDWMMQFDDEIPAIINKDETPEKYLTCNYPIYGDIEYWLFEEVLKTISIDANAVIAVIPKEFKQPVGTEYLQPVGQVFNCRNVVDFVPDDYAILKSEDLSSLLSPEQQQQRVIASQTVLKTANGTEVFTPGQVYYVITTNSYTRWDETAAGKYEPTVTIFHGLNTLPAFHVPGKFVKRVGNQVLKKTPLYPMLPHLNKAARESNDLDAGVIQHLYLEKWRINNTPCPTCGGNGRCAGESGTVICTDCKGSGFSRGKSPFNEIEIKPAAIGEQSIPTPPVGYVEKNVEIIKIQNERIEGHIYKALSSVNMEHLAEAQLNQSGTAKAYDRDEVNNTIYTFAGMLAQVANAVVGFIIDLRYMGVVADAETRKKLRPNIPVPEKFDVINSSFLITEYKTAKDSGLNSIILAEMQKEIGAKKFYANPKVSAFVQSVMDLDPFPDKTIEEKGLMEGQGLAAKEDIILSNYITDFVRLAMEQDPEFATKKDTEKRAILKGFAEIKVKELSSATQVMQDILPGGKVNNQAQGGPNSDQQQASADPNANLNTAGN